MESPTKHSKSRSHHATSNVSSATHHAAKKLHKHALQNNYDRFGRLRDKHSAAISPSPLHHPGQAIADKISRTSNSKHGSRDASTGPSQTPAGEAEAAPVKMPRRPVKPADVARERQRRLRRDEELQSSLNGLADLAYDSNARLDDLFYGILEKVASLRSTIAKLQELSAASKKLHEEFESDTAGFEADFKGQIAAFGDFSAQGKTMGELEERIQSGMKRAQALSDRLEAARERVELWEKRENEWQARTSMRLRICWSCLGVLVAIILAVLLFRKLTGPSLRAEMMNPKLVNSSWVLGDSNSSKDGSLWGGVNGKSQQSQVTAQSKETDPTLRALDEL